MNHLIAVKKSFLLRQPEIVDNVLRALIEGLAFTWSPKSKSACSRPSCAGSESQRSVSPKTAIRIY